MKKRRVLKSWVEDVLCGLFWLLLMFACVDDCSSILVLIIYESIIITLMLGIGYILTKYGKNNSL